MNSENSAIATIAPPLSPSVAVGARPSATQGVVFGFFGVLAFSFTLPFTRIAVAEINPLFVGGGRAVVAAALAIAVLAIVRPPRPRGGQWWRLGIVAVGVVAGFPVLTSLALQTVPAAHGAVVIGLLPVATAIAAVLRGGERPSLLFWLASSAGAVAVVAFVILSSGGFSGLHLADLLLLGAVALAAIGYSEGALLSRELGSWQTICWALIVGLPAMLPLALSGAAAGWPQADVAAWASFAYLAVISQFVGFFAWYRGLAIGPIARVSQIQLIQPVMTIAWSALILGEHLTLLVAAGAVVVLLCAVTAIRSRIRTS
jgi:drug/metabolite transporter (DMT)-like permease